MESKRLRTIFFFLLAYSLGFLTHWTLFKIKSQNFFVENKITDSNDRLPVAPHDLNNDDLMDALHRDMLERMGKSADDFPGRASDTENEMTDDYGLKDFLVRDINRREDDKFVYYEVPLINENGDKLELNVQVKNGIIEIQETSSGTNHQSQSSRSFSIEPGLKEDLASVINEKDKIIIKIPKK